MKLRKKRLKLLICIVFIILGYVICSNFLSLQYESENIKISPNDNNDDKNSSLPITSDPIIDSLYSLSKKDKRIINIINDKDEYPIELLEMLSKNIDMADYVLNYKNKKGKSYSKNIGEVEKGVFPLLLQYDEKWGYGLYGNKVMAINGCGPTAISMAIAGLTGRNDVTPYDVAHYAEENGYYASGGTSWSFMTSGVKHFGINGRELPLNKNSMINELMKGHPIICSMRPGDFTTKGHFILIVGIENGSFVINDSNSKERSAKLWTYEQISSQIKNLWALSAK